MGNRIDFAKDTLKNEDKIKGEPKVYYSLRKYKKKGSYDILADISEHVTLVNLMNSLENVNRAISVVGYNGYLSQSIKEYLYLIENNWI